MVALDKRPVRSYVNEPNLGPSQLEEKQGGPEADVCESATDEGSAGQVAFTEGAASSLSGLSRTC